MFIQGISLHLRYYWFCWSDCRSWPYHHQVLIETHFREYAQVFYSDVFWNASLPVFSLAEMVNSQLYPTHLDLVSCCWIK